MRQHAIDLMPASIRARSQAGMRAGRFIAATTLALLVLVIVATHSRLRLTSAEDMLFRVQVQAEAVFAIDAKADALRTELERSNAFIQLYEKVAFPMEMSAVMATVINALPASVTLDQLDMDAGARISARTPRSRGVDGREEVLPRVLTCELSGFAASDEHIAELVSRLENTPPFRNVNLDFSRTKKVHERDAREFRLSFKMDLSARYEVVYGAAERGETHAASSRGLANAQ